MRYLRPAILAGAAALLAAGAAHAATAKSHQLKVPLPDGSIAFLPEGGGDEPLFVIPKPYMVDATDDPASPYGKRFSDKVTQTVSQDGDEVEVTVRADAAWLAAADRRYPVVVDPTIKIQPITWEQSLDVEIRSDAPSTNFDGTWQLPVGSTSAMKARSLVKFPLTDVPSGTQITTALAPADPVL